MGFYFRTRVSTVWLISCLPKTNKGLDVDFLIILGDWHDGYHCPVRDGTLGRVIKGLEFQHHKYLKGLRATLVSRNLCGI